MTSNALSGLYLFGSAARGDFDDSSDLDVLAVYETPPNEVLRRHVGEAIQNKLGNRATLAEYSVQRLAEIFESGHLFAWHLFLESRPLQIHAIKFFHRHKFSRPTQYKDGIADARRFTELISSVKSESKQQSCSIVHEAGILYLSLRNIAMSLSNEMVGRTDFSRLSPLNISSTINISPPCSHASFNKLIQARHASQRGLAAPSFTNEEFSQIIETSEAWGQVMLSKMQ